MSSERKATDVRVSLAEDRNYTLPPETRQIEVLSGGAWVSLGLDDVVVRRHQVIQVHPGRQQVVVTPLGKGRLEFIMSA
jgi:hypothetical protein